MKPPAPVRRRFLLALALLFAVATVAYSALWMYYARLQPQVELGFEAENSPATHESSVTKVMNDSPAERAGLKANDRIIAVNGESLIAPSIDSTAPWTRGRPGDIVRLTVVRPGVPDPIVLTATFRARSDSESPLRRAANQILDSYPVIFLIVGLTVLFMRVEDPNAWRLAVLFSGFIAVANLLPAFGALHGAPLAFVYTYRALLVGTFCPVFYYFFAVFPTRSALDRWYPWLKWVLLAIGISFGLSGLRMGNPYFWPGMATLVGPRFARMVVLIFNYGSIALGLISLVSNALTAPTPAARRKIRVLLWGVVIGVTPVVIVRGASDFFYFSKPPFWLDFVVIVLLVVFPLSFAYAVVKHRVLEIPVLLKRSARYLLVQRGFVLLTAALCITATLGFVALFARLLRTNQAIALTTALAAGPAFGALLTWAGIGVHREVTRKIDRAFFRSAYDVRLILEDLAAKTRTAANRNELAELLAGHIRQALHPSALAVYFENSNGFLVPVTGDHFAKLKDISARLPELLALAERGQLWEMSPTAAEALAFLWPPILAECLVPISGRRGQMLGVLVLGARLSEEPYSGEDKRLLATVASQAGVALENIHLAEQMADRMEVERRTAHEIEIARQVQSKLFPQKAPPLATLEYAGKCIQARAVGGDYYDFLDLGDGRVAFVLADIAGKGMSAALLMANLQAHLRSQSAILLQDLSRSLTFVNRLFYESTEPSSYTTLFIGIYDDAGRTLTYVNCGHNPPLLVHNGGVKYLSATSTVLGLFEDWKCAVAEVRLAPGDLLAIYTDGIVEATNEIEEEFGEGRLLEILRRNSPRDPSSTLDSVIAAVQKFSAGEQGDDLTLLIARTR